MAHSTVYLPRSINSDDLATATADRRYLLGKELTISDEDSGMMKVYKYVQAGDALTAFVPIQVTNSNIVGSEVKTQVPVTITSGAVIGVPQHDFTVGFYGFVLIVGDSQCKYSGSVTAGDFLEILNAGVGAINSGSTTLVSEAFAIAKEDGADTEIKAVTVIGRNNEIKAA